MALPASADGADGTVSGVVVDEREHWPLSGRTVEIGARRAVTDEQGRFQIRDVPARYDVRVSEADGSWVTLYRGVSRRDPLLGQHARDALAEKHQHFAYVKVAVPGSDVSPLGHDLLIIQVRSAKTRDQSLFTNDEALALPPIRVAWDGPEKQLAAEILVARQHYTGRPYQELATGEVSAQHTIARQEFLLQEGQTTQVTVALAPLPAFHLTGTVDPASRQVNWNTSAFAQREVRMEYRWVFGKFGSTLFGPLVSAHGAFDYGIDGPPASEPSRSLCILLLSPIAFTQRCGAPAEQYGSFSLDQPPHLLSPAPSGARGTELAVPPLTNGSRFSWQAPAGVTRLRIAADSTASTTPSFDVYTNDSALNASDFVGSARLSRSEASYVVQLTHFGPFPTVDAAVSNVGIAAPGPIELRTSTSEEVPILTVPEAPPGAVTPIVNIPPGVDPERAVPWAPCQYPVGTELGCGGLSWVSLTAINNSLRHFPEFAFDSHIHCVTNCTEAQALVIAEDAYRETHPYSFASEPLDLPSRPPPPLPEAGRDVGPPSKVAPKPIQKK